MGRLTILDVESGDARHVDLEVELPSGWEPPDDFSREGLLRTPRFVDKQTLVVDLPTGEQRSFTL